MFTLNVFPDGKLLLTTEEMLSHEAVVRIREQFEEWRKSDKGTAIIQECQIQHATSIEIDLESAA